MTLLRRTSAISDARSKLVSFSWLLLLLSAAALTARGAEPSVSTSRLLPARGLIAYVEYEGVGNHAEAWKATAEYGMLNKTPAGEMMTSVARQVMDRLLKESPELAIKSDDLIVLNKYLFEHGYSFALYEGEDDPRVVIVLRGFGGKETRERFKSLGDRLITLLDVGTPLKVHVRGRDVYQYKNIAKKNEELGEAAKVEEPAVVEDSRKHVDDAEMMITLWVEGDDLIVTEARPRDATGGMRKRGDDQKSVKAPEDPLDAVLDAIEGRQPNASKHPATEAALAEGRDVRGFEPNGLFFVDFQGGSLLKALEGFDALNEPKVVLPQLSSRKKEPEPADAPAPAPATEKSKGDVLAELELLGVTGITRVVGRWGFHGKGLVTDVRIEAPSPRPGLLGLIVDQPSRRSDRLLPIPKDARAFVLGSFALQNCLDGLIALAKRLGPDSAKELDSSLKVLEKTILEATGQRLREDLLTHIGPTWCVYTMPDEGRNKTESAMPTLLVEIDDADAVAKVLDALAIRVNTLLRDHKREDAGDKKKPVGEPAAIALEKLPAPDRGYRLVSPAGLVPWLSDEIQPTIQLGKSFAVLSMNPSQARAAVFAESQPENRWKPTGELAKTFEWLPATITSLSVGDPGDSSWPEAIATLPNTVQRWATALGLFDADAGEPSPTSEILALFGVPGPGAFRLRIDSAKVPKAEQLRTFLFPSVLATSVDDHGIRFIGAEAFPLACIGYNSKGRIAKDRNIHIDLNQLLNLRR
jgi:hypothetical protein